MTQSSVFPAKKRTEKYGLEAFQEADLYLPTTKHPAVVCLLHGGFWRMPYGREQLVPMAKDLVSKGFAVWNIGYRRLGANGGGWPGTFNDVILALNHLGSLVQSGIDLDLTRVIVAGHSAGGHLALWSAAQPRRNPSEIEVLTVKPVATIGLAPVIDLISTFDLGSGDNAVGELLGGSPKDISERYSVSSPQEMLPLGVPQLLVHGTQDDALPIEFARNYARSAHTAGDAIDFVELPDAGHMDYLDLNSEAYSVFYQWLARF